MLQTAINAANMAASEIMRIYQWSFDVEIKSDNSPVTIADKKASEVIIWELEKTWLPVLSEERDDNLDRLNSEYVWIVDPIDWTKEFINKTWDFSIMIWLVKNNEVILWVVYLPSEDKLYFAEKWKWSYLIRWWKKSKISVNKENNKFIISSNWNTAKKASEIINNIWYKTIPCWWIWTKLWMIAEWIAWNYIYLYDNLMQRDTCAPDIILREAWWLVSDTMWNTIKYNIENLFLRKWLVVSNWKEHDRLIKEINKSIS